MFKKIMATANRQKQPANTKTVLSVLRWQVVFLAPAFVFAMLDLTNVMQLRGSALLPFVFMALGIGIGAYIDIKDVGVERDRADTDRT